MWHMRRPFVENLLFQLDLEEVLSAGEQSLKTQNASHFFAPLAAFTGSGVCEFKKTRNALKWEKD